jgi:hypothetical protein
MHGMDIMYTSTPFQIFPNMSSIGPGFVLARYVVAPDLLKNKDLNRLTDDIKWYGQLVLRTREGFPLKRVVDYGFDTDWVLQPLASEKPDASDELDPDFLFGCVCLLAAVFECWATATRRKETKVFSLRDEELGPVLSLSLALGRRRLANGANENVLSALKRSPLTSEQEKFLVEWASGSVSIFKGLTGRARRKTVHTQEPGAKATRPPTPQSRNRRSSLGGIADDLV